MERESHSELVLGKPHRAHPFRRAVVRGLGVVLPPLLTVVIFLWIANTVSSYVLVPLEAAARSLLVNQYARNIVAADQVPADQAIRGRAVIDGRPYRRTGDGRFIPADHFEAAEAYAGKSAMPATALDVYRLYVDQRFLQRQYVVPVFLLVFLLLLYLLGRFMAAGVGRFFWSQFESFITRVPLVSSVYGSVKQVTDFVFSEQQLNFTRVVAVEYPRKGAWILAFVTGESFPELERLVGEPVVALLVPTSPMPLTGFTLTVKRSEAIDVNLTLEQAFQFIVSCGVVALSKSEVGKLGGKGKSAANPTAAPTGS